jgi:hypothetical protein
LLPLVSLLPLSFLPEPPPLGFWGISSIHVTNASTASSSLDAAPGNCTLGTPVLLSTLPASYMEPAVPPALLIGQTPETGPTSLSHTWDSPNPIPFCGVFYPPTSISNPPTSP